MATIQDEIYRAKGPGQVNDLLLAHWQGLIVGTAPDDLNEALHAYLVEQGQAAGDLNDMAFAWLDLTYSGALNDMWLSYWQAQ